MSRRRLAGGVAILAMLVITLWLFLILVGPPRLSP